MLFFLQRGWPYGSENHPNEKTRVHGSKVYFWGKNTFLPILLPMANVQRLLKYREAMTRRVYRFVEKNNK